MGSFPKGKADGDKEPSCAAIVPHSTQADSVMDEIVHFVEQNTEAEMNNGLDECTDSWENCYMGYARV